MLSLLFRATLLLDTSDCRLFPVRIIPFLVFLSSFPTCVARHHAE